MRQAKQNKTNPEFRIIKSLLYFNSAKGVSSNLPKEYYTKQIKKKINKYSIKKDYLRKDGWMDYNSLAKEANLPIQSVNSKAQKLVNLGIVEKKQIQWTHYKSKNSIRTKLVYRLKHDSKTLRYLHRLLNYENNFTLGIFLKKLARETSKSYALRMKMYQTKKKSIQQITDTDYFKIVPKSTKEGWLRETAMLVKAKYDAETENLRYIFKQLKMEVLI